MFCFRSATASVRSSFSDAKTQSTSNQGSSRSSSTDSTHSLGSSKTKASSNYGRGTKLSIVDEEDEKRLGDDKSDKDDDKYILQNYEKFDQPFYVECKNEILIKLQNHFNNKDNQEATSFYKTFHNLVVQQVGKLSKEKKFNIKEDDKILFTCHLRDELVSNNILNGHIIKIWSENQINKIDEMLNTTKAFFDVKALTKYLISIKLIPDPDLIKPITEEDKLKLKTAKYASCCFNILKILIKNQFYSTGDVTHSEYSYLNQLFGTVKAHSTSKSTNKDDIELIKSDPRINEVMLHICKQLQVICFNNNEGLEFNTTEIDNINIGFKRDPQFLLKRVTQFTEEFFELTHK